MRVNKASLIGVDDGLPWAEVPAGLLQLAAVGASNAARLPFSLCPLTFRVFRNLYTYRAQVGGALGRVHGATVGKSDRSTPFHAHQQRAIASAAVHPCAEVIPLPKEAMCKRNW